MSLRSSPVRVAVVACALAAPWLAASVAAFHPESAGPIPTDPPTTAGAAQARPPAAGPVPVVRQPWLPGPPDRVLPSARQVEARLASARSRLDRSAQADPFAVIDRCVLDEMEATGTPGASIAIALDGVITYTHGYGVKHLENGGEIGPDTMFRIGSTTKMMTAAAVMTMVDLGEIDLHTPLTEYLPDLRLAPPWDAGAITPWHLLTHSAGLPDSYLTYDEAAMDRQTLELWAYELLGRTPLNNPPGAFWNYSNPNFSLAGLLVQEISGQLATDYIEDEVWEAASMPLTTFRGEDVIAHGDFAHGHYGSERLTPDRWAMPALAPAGTAFSTPTEMVTWALLMMDGGGGVLSEASAAQMQARQIGQGYYDGADYGLGIFVTDYADATDPNTTVPVYDHGGNIQGWSSQLFWVPERHLAFSILANTMTSMSASAACVLSELGGVVPRDIGDQTTDPATWPAYEGVYAVQNQVLWDFTYRITRDQDRLVLSNLDLGGTTPLVQVLRDTFMLDADRNDEPDPATAMLDFTFVRDPDDPDRLSWLRNRVQVGQRVGRFPAAVDLRGSACQSVPFTPEIDMPQLAVRASGLVPPEPLVLARQPITQTEATDPTTAAYRRELQLRGDAGLFLVVVVPQAGDNLELYLLMDIDQDTQFAYPDEVIGVGLPGSSNIRALLMPGRPPAGRYQIWVHGTSVRGAGHTFDMQQVLVDGEQLFVAQAPTSARPGVPATVRLCARDVTGMQGPMKGLLEFDYGWPPRRVRLPVDWTPDPAGAIYLPSGQR